MKAGSLPPIPAEPRRHGHPLTHCFTPPGTFYTLNLPPRQSFPLKISPGPALACSPHQNTQGGDTQRFPKTSNNSRSWWQVLQKALWRDQFPF